MTLNANSSKTVKAMDFKFDTHSQGQSGHDTHKFSQNVTSLAFNGETPVAHAYSATFAPGHRPKLLMFTVTVR